MNENSVDSRTRGAVCGLAAAALFGSSTPFAKLLVPLSSPIVLASLLYLGAAAALFFVGAIRHAALPAVAETPLRRSDMPLLLAITVSGGVVGPALMLFGLGRVSAVAGSLLLNLEAPFTMLIAVAVFGEHLGRREASAAALILGGGITLSGGFENMGGPGVGAIAITGACMCWAIDNNLTQRLSLRDPIAIVRLKALGAGVGNLVIGLAIGARFPPHAASIGAALLLGAVSYGLSIVLDTYALRLIGAAREAAYFATAPFFGAFVGVMLLRENVGPLEVIASVLLALGVTLLIRERHEHEHVHDVLTHDHLHIHDEHHQHAHPDAVSAEPHAHLHTHEPIHHAHRHVSDAHHRHRHQ